MLTALTNITLISNGDITPNQAVLLEGEYIKTIVPAHEVPPQATVADMQGRYAAPGFIDLQIYGAGTALFGSLPSVAALATMEAALLATGTTGFLATIATNSNQVLQQGIAAARAYRQQAQGAFLGLHLEGPFINARRKGAHPEKYIRPATLQVLQQWLADAGGVVKMITLAPELQQPEVLSYLQQQGITISAGHTDASYEQACAFFKGPVTAATHLYNAMPGMHHRAPAIIPAIFENKPYTSIVADGVHVSYPMIALAKRELSNRLFLITDAVTAASEGEYQHRFEGDRYTMPDGTLSGSALTMLKAVQNCVNHVGIPLAEAVNMATLYPAQLAGLSKKGKIAPGYFADITIFNDSFTPACTVLRGKIVYNNIKTLTDES